MKIIGLTGSYASGKDTVADFLIRSGFAYYSLSDLLRKELAIEKKEVSRDNMIAKGNEIRKQMGAQELAKRIIKQIKKDGVEKAVVVSIRNPEEVMFLKNSSEFALWFVDAPVEMRYERSQIRKRPEDRVSFEQFVAQEKEENSDDPLKQQLSEVAKLANVTIQNDSSLEDLSDKTRNLLAEFNQVKV